MFGKVEHELELHVPAREAWDLYGTIRLGQFVEQEIPKMIQKVELIQGDGGVGTVLKVTFAPGIPGATSHTEKFTKINNEKRIKEVEIVEGGVLEYGFTLYRVIFQVIEKGEDSSIIKSTIEYQVQEEEKASLVSILPVATVAEVAKNYFNRNKAVKEANQ